MSKTKWIMDPFFCTIDFSVKHLSITKVRGSFDKFQMNIEADPFDLTAATIDLSIDVNSINTRIKDRDAHLLGPDFFDAENYPTIDFKSKEIIKTGETSYDLIGDVTMHGVTKPETFSVIYTGHQKDPLAENAEKIAFQASITLKRSDYGIEFGNIPTELGGILISNEVNVQVEVQAIPSPAEVVA